MNHSKETLHAEEEGKTEGYLDCTQESCPLLKRPINNEIYDLRNEIYDLRNTFPEDVEFQALIDEAELAIHRGVLPERIDRSTGGSYFVKNRAGVSSLRCFPGFSF